MAKDPTQGPVSTYDEEGNPTQTNVEETPIEEAGEEVTVDESTVEEEVEETADEEDAVEEESEEELSGEENLTEGDGEGEGESVDDEDAVDEDDSFEAHEHEVGAPLSYAEAEKRLKETPYAMLREMAIADELKPERSGAKLIVQLLNHWFAEPPAIASSDSTQPMSARVRRIKEASSQ